MTSDTNAARVDESSGQTPRVSPASTAMVELSREECLDLLASHHFGRLAVVLRNTTPIIRPVNYVFDPRSQSVVFLTARGSKLHALLHAAKAAFEIDGIDENTHTGWSVIIEGVTAEVRVPRDIGRLKRLGLEAWAPGSKPHWVQIRAWTVSGRRIVMRDDASPDLSGGDQPAHSDAPHDASGHP